MLWVLVIPLVGLIVGIVIRRLVFGRFIRRADAPLPPPLNVDFSMADLHEMLRSEKLSPDEFERARLIVLRNNAKRDAEAADAANARAGHGFQVIQKATPRLTPTPTPVPSPLPPVAGAVEGRDVAGDSESRDAR